MKIISTKVCKREAIILLRLFLEKIKYYEEGIFDIIKNIVVPKFNINDECLYLNCLKYDSIILEAKILNKYIENNMIQYKIIYKIDKYFELEYKKNNYNSKTKKVSEYNLIKKN